MFGFRPVRFESSSLDRRTPHNPWPYVMGENRFVAMFQSPGGDETPPEHEYLLRKLGDH
jgi:hypothetical protein